VSYVRGEPEQQVDPVQVLEELSTNPLQLTEWIQDARLQVEGSRLQSINDMLRSAEDRLSYAVSNYPESAFLQGLLLAILVGTARHKEANKLIKDMLAHNQSNPGAWQLATGYLAKFRPTLVGSVGLEYFHK
jgi:predicted Zn-dependent protease